MQVEHPIYISNLYACENDPWIWCYEKDIYLDSKKCTFKIKNKGIEQKYKPREIMYQRFECLTRVWIYASSFGFLHLYDHLNPQ